MSPKFINFEIILVYFILLIPWPHTDVIKLLCSKDNSRLVRKIVRSKWMPILDKYQVKLPLECPLHPFRDIFAPRQDAKKRDRPTQWTCRLCGKSFYKEKFLDLHFEMRHKSTINEAEDAVCLADLCDIMRCEVFQTEESSSLKTGDQHLVTDIEVWGDSLGQNSALAKANVAYLSLIPLRASSIGGSRATKAQSRQLCQDKIAQNKFKDTVDETKSKITNDSVMKKDTSGSSSSTSTTTETSGTSSAQTSAKHGKTNKSQNSSKTSKAESEELRIENENITTNDNKTQSNNTTNMQKMRANCKAEELNKLKANCEYLVHSCIGSLVLSMNDQAFKEMEDEMNKAICWYLSCDRYWEDGPLEPRAFPWGLILILVFVLSTGICFCYYIIWILFDSEETTINHHHMYRHQPLHQQYPSNEQHYYYQQHDLYPEQPQYDYRHSPRRYIADQRQRQQQITPTTAGGQATTQTPLHHHQTNLAYQQDILDRRDYTSSRPIATTAVTSGSSVNIVPVGNANSNIASSSTAASASSASASATANTASMDGGNKNVTGTGSGGKHYNTHPRPLGSQQRHAGASQQSLRGSSSSHDIMQNEIGHNEHYIYVTYPPDLKKRFFEKYE